MKTKKETRIAGKVALIAGIALFGIIALAGCTTDPTTGETTFAPVEALKGVAESVANIPDESKAQMLEGLAALLAATGVGAVAVPAVKMGASYFRNKSETKKSKADDAGADEEKVEE